MDCDQPRIELVAKIGQGTFGEVWLGRHHESSTVKYVALKLEKIVIPDGGIKKEFEVMKNIDKHQNLIEYIEFAENVERVRQTGVDVI